MEQGYKFHHGALLAIGYWSFLLQKTEFDHLQENEDPQPTPRGPNYIYPCPPSKANPILKIFNPEHTDTTDLASGY